MEYISVGIGLKKAMSVDLQLLHTFHSFLLPATVFCVAEELVVLITPCPLPMFNYNRLQAFQASTLAKKQLEMKNEGGG